MMSFDGWSGQLEGTLGTGYRAGEQMERPTPAPYCARQAYSTWFPTSLVASRIGVGSGLDRPIASLGQPPARKLFIDLHQRPLSTPVSLEAL